MAVRLLLDENLSERLLQPLAELFPGSEHIAILTKSGTSDRLLWGLARTGGYILTTRDEDFVGMSVLQEAPPKVLWLNVGKSRNAVIAALLRPGKIEVVAQRCFNLTRRTSSALPSMMSTHFLRSASIRLPPRAETRLFRRHGPPCDTSA